METSKNRWNKVNSRTNTFSERKTSNLHNELKFSKAKGSRHHLTINKISEERPKPRYYNRDFLLLSWVPCSHTSIPLYTHIHTHMLSFHKNRIWQIYPLNCSSEVETNWSGESWEEFTHSIRKWQARAA